MNSEQGLGDDIVRFIESVMLVQTVVLWRLFSRRATVWQRDLQGLPNPLHVAPIDILNGRAQGNAVGVGQQAALGAGFGAVSWIGAFFSPKGAEDGLRGVGFGRAGMWQARGWALPRGSNDSGARSLFGRYSRINAG